MLNCSFSHEVRAEGSSGQAWMKVALCLFAKCRGMKQDLEKSHLVNGLSTSLPSGFPSEIRQSIYMGTDPSTYSEGD